MGEYGVTYKSCRMKGRGKMLQLYLNSKKNGKKSETVKVFVRLSGQGTLMLR